VLEARAPARGDCRRELYILDPNEQKERSSAVFNLKWRTARLRDSEDPIEPLRYAGGRLAVASLKCKCENFS